MISENGAINELVWRLVNAIDTSLPPLTADDQLISNNPSTKLFCNQLSCWDIWYWRIHGNEHIYIPDFEAVVLRLFYFHKLVQL